MTNISNNIFTTRDTNDINISQTAINSHISRNRAAITTLDCDLRGYNENTWMIGGDCDANYLLSNITIGSIIGHLYCPICAYRSYKEHIFIETAETVQGRIYHFVIEEFFAKEIDFVRNYELRSDYHLFLEYLLTLKKDIKDRFGYTYNKVGGNIEETWNNIEHILKNRFAKLLIKTEKNIPSRQFEVPLWSKQLGLRGRLDVLEDSNIPLEIKTGRAPRSGYYLSHAIQLALYSLVLENKTHTDIDEGYIYYARTDEKYIITIDNCLRKEALKQRDIALHTFQSQKEPQAAGRCRRCTSQDTQDRTTIQGDNANNATSIIISAKAQGIKKSFNRGQGE